MANTPSPSKLQWEGRVLGERLRGTLHRARDQHLPGLPEPPLCTRDRDSDGDSSPRLATGCHCHQRTVPSQCSGSLLGSTCRPRTHGAAAVIPTPSILSHPPPLDIITHPLPKAPASSTSSKGKGCILTWPTHQERTAFLCLKDFPWENRGRGGNRQGDAHPFGAL